MKVGFTGTREGVVLSQERYIEDWLCATSVSEAHHGCCVGADTFFAILCLDHESIRLIGHPSTLGNLTSKHAVAHSDEVREPRPPLDRNRDIVDETDMLIAVPGGMAEERRSGTWATVRYARKQGKPILIVFPDGSVKEENQPLARKKNDEAPPLVQAAVDPEADLAYFLDLRKRLAGVTLEICDRAVLLARALITERQRNGKTSSS